MSKIILKETVTHLRSEDEKSVRIIPFNVPEGINKLFITYSYAPKILVDREKSYELIKENLIRDAGDEWSEYTDYEEFMPLKNLVTLALNSPEGYCGAAHRQADSQYHEIGEAFSSPGFVRCKITEGQWDLKLHVHALITDVCTCDIKIEGEVAG